MDLRWLLTVFRKRPGPLGRPRIDADRRRTFRLSFERLEDRTTPSSFLHFSNLLNASDVFSGARFASHFAVPAQRATRDTTVAPLSGQIFRFASANVPAQQPANNNPATPNQHPLLDDHFAEGDRFDGAVAAVLDSGSDGVSQISRILDQFHGLDSVQFSSPGEAGTGAFIWAMRDGTPLPDHAEALHGWSSTLNDTDDIHFRGRDVAGISNSDTTTSLISSLGATATSAAFVPTDLAPQGGQAEVMTQDPDYSPGQTATIDASGFQLGETVQFQVFNLTNGNAYSSWAVTDGGPTDQDGVANGEIETAWLVPQDAAQSQLVVTATGESSGLMAQYAFHDSVSGFSLGAAANYAILFEGGGNNTLQVTNVTTNVTGSGPGQGGGIGNVGVGGTGKVKLNGPGTFNGNLDISAANTGQVTGNGITITGTTSFSVSAVTDALDTVNALNTTLGALPGTNIGVGGTTTINAIDGTFSASGAGYTNVRVFTVNSLNLGQGQTLTINGDPNGDSVVLNVASSTNFSGSVVLTGGLTPDNVIFNFVGGGNPPLTGGHSLTISTGATGLAQGIFLDPNGRVTIGAGNVLGRVFGGDSNDFQFNGPSNVTAPGSGATPTITTTPTPTAVILGATAPVLTDTATLSGGTSPTGTITFELFYNGGATPVHTETVAVNGDGTYTTPIGFTLPTTGTVTGTYQWDATYGGDATNNTFADFNDISEQVTVSAASPTITTSPNPTNVTLATNSVTLTDTATLAGGYHPTGTITFTLVTPGGGTLDTETVAVSGNGAYTTPTGFTLPTGGTVTGTYQWNASYSGDASNNTVSDNDAPTERVTVSSASPTITTSPNPTNVTLATSSVTLTDTATLAGGYHPTGTLTFTLVAPGGGTLDTETVAVNGNGTYTTPTGFTLPATGTVTGTYQWNASYSGDAGNHAASDNNDPTEQVTVSRASPTITTTPIPTSVDLGVGSVTLTDTAALAGGYHPTGTITFTLFFNGGSTPVDTETVIVNGNGSYATPTGFTLPATGAVTGTYQWDATYGGDLDNNTASDTNALNEVVTVSAGRPTLITIASPTTITLGSTAPPVLTDIADLENGFNPNGTITFTLFYNGGPTPVDTESVAVDGNGIYRTPTGFTLPATGAVTGTYQWIASFSDRFGNNTGVTDADDPNEQVTVSAASPTLATIPGQRAITLGTSTVILTDTAVLSDGYHPTGTITFTLVAPGGDTVDTETVTVNGNGAYTTPTGYTLMITGGVTGTYQWNATYSGDGDNNLASDNNNTDEQVTISKAGPTITTTPSPTTVTLGTSSVTLTDTADIEGGSNPTGTITFTLVAPGGSTVHTETVAVKGDGTYTTPTGFTLPATGAETGTYQWNASYSGDNNDDPSSSINDPNEQVTVSAASPTLDTVPSPDTVTLGAADPPVLTDSAILAGGFNPTGMITFTLFFNGGSTPVDTETAMVSGNGTYTTPTGFTLPTTGTAAGTYQWNATYSGDSDNSPLSDNNDPNERVTVSAASPTLATTPNPNTVTAGVTLKDTAFLQEGFHPTGTITFTLFFNGGSAPVDTETVAVNGNGSYTTPTGFTPGSASGTYQWNATYTGDANNNAASDVDNPAEQVTAIVPPLTLITTPTPAIVALGAIPVTLNDSADLEGGLAPTGTITFTLFQGATLLDTEMVTVTGDGVYTTPAGFTLPSTGTATGTYQWNATYSGDSNHGPLSDVDNPNERVTVSAASPTLDTAPTPDTVMLGTTPVTLTDAAQLVNGFHPAGTITFTLFHNGASTPVDTETVAVNGNGTYTTPTGFTLPTTGTATGTYQWDATYSGDSNNTAVRDNNNVDEQVTVSAASPTLTTTPNQDTVTLGTTPVTLKDSAVLQNGYHPTGTITFTLFYNGGSTPVNTEAVIVNGNGTYATPTGFTLPSSGMLAGTYQWDATYSGDSNNDTASDNDNADEQVTVRAASPTVVTLADPTGTITLGTTSPTLNDTAAVAGGYNPTGTLLFTLKQGSTTVFTQTDTVNGNGTYTTAGFTLPKTGTATGTYTWTAAYSGDGNNNADNDQGGAAEQVTVSAATPTLTTTPDPTTVNLSDTTPPILTDSATLTGGYHPTGTITFTLVGPGGGTVDMETVAVSGNGTYTTPTGFTLPTTGTATGTYQWNATYSGDSDNSSVSDNNAVNERVTASAASPTLTTTPNPTMVDLSDTAPPILTDSATLTGGYHPTGTITFTLIAPGGGTADTETVTVSGNGTYTTPTGFTLPATGTTTGTYQWDATYSGDANNSSASDNNAADEQVTVSNASPTLSTTPIPAAVTLGTTLVTLTDSATLADGFNPTGTITFTLFFNGGATPVDTETVQVNGNGTYTTPIGFTLPTTGTASGIYEWDATYSGDIDNNSVSDNDAANEQVTVSAAIPTLSTTPIPDTVTLGAAPVTLTDSATLANGFNPTGTITFTLFQNGRLVDTETVQVFGNGIYATPTGFALPTSGAATGMFQWDASYSGDTNNNVASDLNNPDEQVTVSAANPTLTTVPSPETVTLGATPVTLNDTADLQNGFNPTGTLTFRLFFNGMINPVDTETVQVNGNGIYTTPIGFTLPGTNPLGGTVTGTYLWEATYSSDINNNPATDNDPTTEQVTVNSALPTLITTPSPNTLASGVTLKDTADLEGGFRPTGTITFMLFFNGGATPVDTETVQVNGNGTYTTPTGFTLPDTGPVTGTYQWDASYSGDANNDPATDVDNPTEQVTVTAPAITLTTIPTPGILGPNPVTLRDTALLEGGLNPTGTITFTLFYNGGSTPVDTETVTVVGAGAYVTPNGFTLPSTGTVTGTYQWNASYSGDANNNPAGENDSITERVTVRAANPTLSTTPTPTTVVLDANPVTLQDTADLENGFNSTGTITFTLFHNGGGTSVDTETVAVNGNGIYTTPTGFTLPSSSTATGTYQWIATYNGDTNNNSVSDNDAVNEQVTVSAASPTLATIPIPQTVELGTTPVTLRDAAHLANGFNPIGTITFTLFYDGDTTPVDTETVTVNGNGTYTTPTGFRLPTTGSVTGIYQWDATYNGDSNNNTASDVNDINERVTVIDARPRLATFPIPTTVTLGTAPVTLNDEADLEEGFNPTGTITFRLFYNGGSTPVDTEMVTVNGNGIYSTSIGHTLPTTGAVTGTYQWVATYSGDANNNPASDSSDDFPETVTVNAASPAVVTIANPNGTITLGTTTPTLNDTAVVAGGYNPTGTLLFTLKQGNTTVFTQTDTVSGNGTYTTAGFTLPTTGTATGTYTWTAAYSGDGNNNADNDQGGAAEQVTVSAASPTLTTTPNPTTVDLSATAPPILTDSATLTGGFNPTGTITFTLVATGGGTVDTETVTVSGNGIYTTPTGFTLPATGTVIGTYQWNASYSGDTNNNTASDVNVVSERVTVSAASPTLLTTPIPTTVALRTTGVILTDSATLADGFRPTGTITFRLVAPGGGTVDTETVAVNGNGTYTTPTGFTLPTTGAATGIYQWDATYSGDANNNSVSDNNAVNEQVIVSAASPTLNTSPSPETVRLGTTLVTLTDTADLENGYHPGGTITFTLVAPGGGTVDTETVAVNGNGIYTTPTGFTLPITGSVTGTYQWNATYSGDSNNSSVSDDNDLTEQVTVSAARPVLVTIPTPGILGPNPVTLRDTALLQGGFNPTGTITFTLFYNGGSAPVDTEMVMVVGNGAYVTPTGFALPSTGAVTGTYQWNATYSGDSNNSSVSDLNDASEQVSVSAARPSLTTAPNPDTVTLGATTPPILTDSANLVGGFNPTGTITFTLVAPGGGTVDTETVTVSGNGNYTTPTGFTLPTSGIVTGTYQWRATYSGDANNNAANDQGGSTEQVTISGASPTLVTTPSPNTLAAGVTLKDTAFLEGSFNPTGTITFTLFFNGGTTPVDTETVTVNGNGTYTTPTGFAPGTASGIYQWNAAYSGDTNNNTASDVDNPTERVTVIVPPLTLTTAPTPTIIALDENPVTLNDTADLEGGLEPTGTITFTLVAPGGGTVDTEMVTVIGDGIYTTPTGFTLPDTGTATGTYQWNAAYSGDSDHGPLSEVNNPNERVRVIAASPGLATIPIPDTVALDATSVTLNDTAQLIFGFNPTGTITFTLFHNGGATPVDTEMVTVNGNGFYTTPTGFTLPDTGTATGIYQWKATYSGDSNNNPTNDNSSDFPEQVTVIAARPALATIPIPDTVTLGTSAVTLKDAAQLANGFNPTGTITFTLFQGVTPVDTETVTVNGNGIYTTPTGFTLPTTGTATGTYLWKATYSGDTNNTAASDSTDDFPEDVTVSAASPTITTTPNPDTVTLGTTSVTLKDTADLENGYHPTGSITFTLFYNGGTTPVDTETVTVSGNGVYTTPTGFPLSISGLVTGSYQWVATYSGDTNNSSATDNDPANETVTVSEATPTLTTTSIPDMVTLGPTSVTLKDAAVLANGYHPTGTITFTLFHNGGGTPVDTETVAVNGNGVYATPTGFTLPTSGAVAGMYQWVAIYSGDDSNAEVSDSNPVGEEVIVTQASPTITTTASPSMVALPTPGGTLTDSAVLSGGFNPTGSILFTLTGPGGFSYTQTVTVSGNATYTAALPTALTTAGTYTWTANYEGDDNNNAAADQGGAAEQTVVGAASLSLVTIASPNVTLPAGPPGTVTLSDTAFLSGGQLPTGSIVFTLTGPDSFSYTQTDTVGGNGTYSAQNTLPTTGMVAGTYTWTAQYDGDSNNNPADDQAGIAEQTVVSPASPTVVTTAGLLRIELGGMSQTLNDVAVLAGGYYPTGTLLFTLQQGSNTVFTDTETVTGNGTYTTPGYTLPTTGTVIGTYTWTVAYSGDANNNIANDQGGAAEQLVITPANPTLKTTPNPTALTLGDITPPLLTDSATLDNGANPTGTITFTLFYNGGTTPVDTETVTVSGNGVYATPTGFTLPTSGPVTGTYQWNATYSGDANNNAVSDVNDNAEQVTVSGATPTLTTSPTPATITLGVATPPILTDTADLENGYHPSGAITFTLFHNGGATPVDTEIVTASGNGLYTTPTGFTLPSSGAVAGSYQWIAIYSGDDNNAEVSDNDPVGEEVIVTQASPTITTTASPSMVALPTPGGTLTDSAVLSGGFNPTGSILFTLTGPGGFSYTQTVTVSGNATYTAALPTALTTAGTYTWTANYEGDDNNNAAADQGGAAEQTVVGAASLSLVTIASPNVTLPAGPPGTVTLSDTAFLSGGQLPTGSVVFTLTGPDSFSYTQTDTVNGNGRYTASTTLATTGMVAGTYTWTAHYGGDSNNNPADDQAGIAEQTVVSPANPTVVTTASPITITLGATAPTLSDSAVLAGGYFPTGSIFFTLTGPAGFSYMQTDTVSGNGTYSASTTLPTTGTVAGTYTWSVTYGSDDNNNAVTETGTATNGEQTVVGPASPTIVTTASPAIRQGTKAATLTDTAVLSGGYFPTGSIVFMVTSPNGFSYMQTDPVNGNGIYTASTPLPTTGTVAGTYTWTAHYVGDANNNAVDDQGGPAEQVIVAPTSPTLLTTASPAITLGATPPTLSDSAVLSGGFSPTGSIVFTLSGPNGFSYTQADPVSGNGTYMASTSLASTGTVAGTYTWSVTYEGDVNNNAAIDQGGPTEQTVVSPANPMIVTTASPNVMLPTGPTGTVTLTDSAVLSSGFNPTGTITFTLVHNTTTVDTETVMVNGNGVYTTPTGFILPSSGTVTGTYQWDATYNGDLNNNPASDIDATNERVTVSPAVPTLTTTPSPTTTPLGTTLQDLADLTGGYHPAGSITFRLYAPGVDPTVGPATYTETVTVVDGNGLYHTIVGFASNASGIWHWVATYNGDSNNNSAPSGPLDEPVTVLPQAVSKTVGNATLNIGNTITNTITGINNGPGPATNVIVQAKPPAGLVLDIGSYAAYEEELARLSGYVYHDEDNDGRFGFDESGIRGVVVTVSGMTNSGALWSRTVTTQEDGYYVFEFLPPGVYSVTHVQPEGYLEGTNAVGNVNGTRTGELVADTAIARIELPRDGEGIHYDFGEILPASIAGHVYRDDNGNGRWDDGEPPLSGVTLRLTGQDDRRQTVSRTVETDENGYYAFANLRPGTYQVTSVARNGHVPVHGGVGSAGGTSENGSTVGGIMLPAGTRARNYDFGHAPNRAGGMLNRPNDADGAGTRSARAAADDSNALLAFFLATTVVAGTVGFVSELPVSEKRRGAANDHANPGRGNRSSLSRSPTKCGHSRCA